MNSYSIRDLEFFSGIKAHTIRIWEKRYGVFDPDRTATNIRRYSENELIRLLNYATLLDQGWKISKIARLSESDLVFQVKKLFQIEGQSVLSAHVNSMIIHTIKLEDSGLNNIISRAFLQLGVQDTVLRILYPFMNRLGLMWRTRELSPAQEHFASCIIRRKLICAIDQQVPESTRGSSFLLFLPEDENHELGLLLAHYLLNQQGFKVIYLGQDVPLFSLRQAHSITNPTFLFTVILMAKPLDQLRSEIQTLLEEFPSTGLVVAGNIPLEVSFLQSNRLKILRSVPELGKLISSGFFS